MDRLRLVPCLLVPALLLTAAAPPAAAAPARDMGVVCPQERLPPYGFGDVPAASTFAPAIACLLGTGAATGVSSTSYAPVAPVSRGQMALFLKRVGALAGTPMTGDGAPRFSDLDDAPEPVREAAEELADNGVLSGYPDGTYRPWQPVRRDQMATFLAQLQTAVDGPRPEPEDCFDDLDGNVHAESAGTMCALGVAVGSGDRAYSPAAEVSRAQMAGFLSRLLDVDAEAGLVQPLAPVPAYESSVAPIDEATRERMSASYREGCPVPLSDLRLVRLRHWGFDGRTHLGELVLHADAADTVVQVLGEAYTARFPVERIHLVDEYGADDARSMAANNTSAFNCRTVGSSSTWSQHAYGRALDVNPVQNPYVSGAGAVEPDAGRAYTDRGDVRPAMVLRGDVVQDGFARAGWGWGGDFSRSKDYQHFSANGR